MSLFSYFLCWFAICVLGFLLDIITFRLFLQQCERDIAYNKRIMDENPHLDSRMLDKEVHDAISNLATNLQSKYPQYRVYPGFGRDSIRLKNSYEYIQRYLICFAEKGSDGGQYGSELSLNMV